MLQNKAASIAWNAENQAHIIVGAAAVLGRGRGRTLASGRRVPA